MCFVRVCVCVSHSQRRPQRHQQRSLAVRRCATSGRGMHAKHPDRTARPRRPGWRHICSHNTGDQTHKVKKPGGAKQTETEIEIETERQRGRHDYTPSHSGSPDGARRCPRCDLRRHRLARPSQGEHKARTRLGLISGQITDLEIRSLLEDSSLAFYHSCNSPRPAPTQWRTPRSTA